MPTPEFRPTLYMKSSCPFCLKLAAFLAEAGLYEDFNVKSFWPEDDQDREIRNELAPFFDKLSFPTAEVEPGKFISESDVLITYFAEKYKLDPESMPFYQYTLAGPYRRLREQFRELKTLREKLELKA